MIERTFIGQFERVLPVNYTPVNYGLLYNWFAATDVRNIAAEGWGVPTETNWQTLLDYSGTSANAAIKLKLVSNTYWTPSDLDATNEYLFNLKGAGLRSGNFGTFGSVNQTTSLLTSTAFFAQTRFIYIYYSNGYIKNSGNRKDGNSIRLIKTTTTLTHGQTGTYTGNDGKVYRTICIGTQEWLADNLAETRFRNGDLIPFAGANGINFTNAEWAALTTAGVCPYNNDWSNVLIAA